MIIFKYIYQLTLFLLFFLLGDFLSDLISNFLLIPGSIIGMLLLYFALNLKLVKLEHIDDTGNFFLKHMGFFFIPLGVSLMDSFILIKDILWQILLILIFSNILVMGITGKVTDFLIKRTDS